MNYYNEVDKNAARWLRNLVAAELIPDGLVDERSIVDVRPADLAGFAQCHFFAGIGGWSRALHLAGWPEDRPIWTGSCPCQPFSVAGRRRGADDARHLWPDMLRLVRARRPAVVVGEQVAGAAGYGWFDGVQSDLEGEGYASRAVDIPACAVDAPHIRSRLYWCAVAGPDTGGFHAQRRGAFAGASAKMQGNTKERERVRADLGQYNGPFVLADAYGAGLEFRAGERSDDAAQCAPTERNHGGGGMADADRGGRDGWTQNALGRAEQRAIIERPHARGFWHNHEWLACHDGRTRRTQPGTFLLAHGIPSRVAKWRGFGNAIVPPLAAEAIAALMETMP